MPRSPVMNPFALFVVVLLAVALAVGAMLNPAKPILSNWTVQNSAAKAISGAAAEALAYAAEPISGVAQAQGVGQDALAAYLRASTERESVGENSISFFQRDVAGGTLDFFVVQLNQHASIRLINADDATPGSDERGDTMWMDGQRHLRTVQEMANAPYAVRDQHELLGAIAFGFHGEPRTANEGTVVIDSAVLRSNPGRGTLCITHERRAEIGKFSIEELARCVQAIGGGPVILWENKVAHPDIGAATDEFVPFNPLDEDFVQLDWRKKIYAGLYPKTAVGIGLLGNGESYLVLATSHNMTGVDLARQLRDMGCYAALGGDDDTSTQAVWRGNLVRETHPRAVPDAIGVYFKQ